MITNNLFIKLKKRDAGNIEKTKNILLSMKGKIPVLLNIQVEADVKAGESSYDLMLITKFNTLEDKDIYLAHPVHVEVSNYIKEAMESGASLCYETN
ncbi:hypothetical protein FACS1894163_06550 [Spirochaetia bacterium]|nr:hypothetical protein FACS1894163_06550 [Spirochaetia bacterium]